MENVSLFGSTIRETINAFRSYSDNFRTELRVDGKVIRIKKGRLLSESEIDDLAEVTKSANESEVRQFDEGYAKGKKNKKSKGKVTEAVNEKSDIFENRLKVVMRIVVTLILLGISIYLLVVNTTESKTLPCSIISAITGYWLK
jgi:hypothetical protein